VGEKQQVNFGFDLKMRGFVTLKHIPGKQVESVRQGL
jgi:hypothetical protein